jgi:hypothetical protein
MNSNLIDLDKLDYENNNDNDNDNDNDNNIRESHKGLESTSTDMLVGLLANSDKLKSSDQRWDYEKGQVDDDREINDDLDNYETKPSHNIKPNNVQENNNLFVQHKVNTEDKKDDIKYDINKDHKETLSTVIDNVDNTIEQNNNDVSEDEIILKKLDMLRKLGELKQRGANLSQNYSLNSNYKHMEYEYKLHHDIRSKQNSIHWMSHMFVGAIKGLEMLNDHYNPFDIKLDGLSSKISDDMDPYYDVMSEIYEKHNGPGRKMQPEYRLILMVAGAALQMQIGKMVPDSISNMAGGLKDNVATIQELKHKASASSDAYRNSIDKKINDEHVKRQKDLSDLELIKQKELEYKKLKREAENTTLRDNLILSTESPSMYNMNYNKHQEKMNKLRQLEVENLARKQKIQDIQATKKHNQLLMEKNRLNSILEDIESNNDSNMIDDMSITEQSTESVVSVNPDIENIMNKNIKVKKNRRVKVSNDVISYDDITIGSNEKKKHKSTTITTN